MVSIDEYVKIQIIKEFIVWSVFPVVSKLRYLGWKHSGQWHGDFRGTLNDVWDHSNEG